MRAVLLALVLLSAVSIVAPISAQTYPSMRPIPRTTSLPALRALALRREIHERFTLGLDAEAKNAWSKAIPEFERIVALRPAEPLGSTAQYDLALAYAHLRRYGAAAHALQAAIALDPGFLAAMANLVSVDLARNDRTGARAIAERFVRLAPMSARALYARGIVALRSGDAATARAVFGQLLRNDPSYALAHYDLGLAEEKMAKYDDAVTEFTAALQLAPSYARARFALGAVLLRQGKRAEARGDFARVASDANGDPSLRTLASAMRDSISAHK